MESSIVIKVKYGETLRRFNAQVDDEKLGLNMDELRDKIFQLFNFAPDTELTLTYIDEDKDVVTLVDDEDLKDVVRQDLNPLRIYVTLNTEKSGKPSARSSGNSTPLRSPRGQSTFPNLNSSVSDVLKSVPEPLRETLAKYADVAVSGSSSANVLDALANDLSRIGLYYYNKTLGSQPGTGTASQGRASGSTTDVTGAKGFSGSRVDETSQSFPIVDETSQSFPRVESGVPSLKKNEPFQVLNAGERSLKTVEPPSVIATSKPKSLEEDRIETLLESSSKGPKPNSSLVDGKKAEGKKFGVCHLVQKALGNSYSSTSPVGSGKEADKLPPESHDGAKPVGVGDSASFDDSKWCTWDYPSVDGRGSSTNTRMPRPVPISPLLRITNDVIRRHHSHSHNHRDGIHRGVQCDVCEVHPITGPRFKSKVKEDYDLCSICFAEMGNDADYIRMDRPVTYRHASAFKGLYDPHGRMYSSTVPQVFRGCGMKIGRPKLDSRFVQDVNVLDGTIMAPLTRFTKIWRMRNNGNIVWPQGTQLVYITGDKLSDALAVRLEITPAGLPVDQELDVAVDFAAPELPGRYISYWRMSTATGQKFGQRVWVLIEVDASVNLPKIQLVNEVYQGFNLNLPPPSNGVDGPETSNLNPKPIVADVDPLPKIISSALEDMVVAGNPNIEQESKFHTDHELSIGSGDKSSHSPSAPGSSVSYPPIIDLYEPVFDVNPNNEQEAKSHTNHGLQVGFGDKSSDSPSAPGSSVSYPSIDLSEAAPAVTSAAPPSVAELQASSEDVGGSNDVELTLLKELEDMGFKQVDLNKEILRRNGYDLEQSVDDLCGVSEWDPILEELEEMGFRDKAMNKKLLEKNNGSIKRVVMDLIAGEK